MPATSGAPSDNLRGSAWLIADMSLNIWALSIVKLMGADYPAVQIVFLRAAVGFAVIAPWAWHSRTRFSGLADRNLHLLRVVLSAVTLIASFFAIARVPLATFTAVNFVRPVLLMVLAALILNERIAARRWLAMALAFGGALVVAVPWSGNGQAGDLHILGLASLCLAVTTGTLAIIVTRRLKGTPEVVMMLFYTGGISIILAPLAFLNWVPVAQPDWAALLLVGVFAQAAQLCFLRAHWLGDAGVLAPVSYLSIVLSTVVGFLIFDETPGLPLLYGASMIILANLAIVWKGHASKT